MNQTEKGKGRNFTQNLIFGLDDSLLPQQVPELTLIVVCHYLTFCKMYDLIKISENLAFTRKIRHCFSIKAHPVTDSLTTVKRGPEGLISLSMKAGTQGLTHPNTDFDTRNEEKPDTKPSSQLLL